jgi:hypothetical protein
MKGAAMPATPESVARTRAFARVIGPFIALVVGALELRAGEMTKIGPLFFENAVIVWMTAALLVFVGIFIIGFHQYWRSSAAILISLFGWFLLMRGLVLLYAPQLMARAVNRAVGGDTVLYIRLGFSVMLLIGLWLTYVGWIARPAAQNHTPR